MVQYRLSGGRKGAGIRRAAASILVLLCLVPRGLAKTRKTPPLVPPPDLLLEGGRKLTWERSFSSDKDVRKPGFFGKIVNFAIGEPDAHPMVRPYSIAVDSRGRAIITDPGASGVHIFDFNAHKYKFLERTDKSRKDRMWSPQCVTVDAQDYIYITDSQAGKIFVYNPEGKFQRVIGNLKGGEGFFKRPTGIAVDSAARRIYVTDTLRDKIYVLDWDGKVMQTYGEHGSGSGQFNYPTELLLRGDDLVVVDAMNFRVQFLDKNGKFRSSIGQIGDAAGDMFRPKGIGMDSEGHYYISDGLWGVVQVFDREGQLLYYFGQRGTAVGDFQLPAGLFIDREDRVFVVDSYNHRIQVFRYFAAKGSAR